MKVEDSLEEENSVQLDHAITVMELSRSQPEPPSTPQTTTFIEIIKAYIPLSLTSFGGPSAHVSMYLEKFVIQDKWISEKMFTELFAISQSLPGPASTQLGYSIALLRGGVLAGLLSFICWSLPGMIIMIGFAYGINQIGNSLPLWLQYVSNGLTSAALGLVALAAYKLSTKLLTNPLLVVIGVISASLAVNFTSITWLYPAIIVGGGMITFTQSYIEKKRAARIERESRTNVEENVDVNVSSPDVAPEVDTNIYSSFKVGLIVLFTWLVLLALSIVFKTISTIPLALKVFGNLYFAGSIIFGNFLLI